MMEKGFYSVENFYSKLEIKEVRLGPFYYIQNLHNIYIPSIPTSFFPNQSEAGGAGIHLFNNR